MGCNMCFLYFGAINYKDFFQLIIDVLEEIICNANDLLLITNYLLLITNYFLH